MHSHSIPDINYPDRFPGVFTPLLLLLALLLSTPVSAQTDPITINGEIAYGASSWRADVRFNRLELNTGERLNVHLDATLILPDPERYRYGASFYLVPVANANGDPISAHIPLMNAEQRPILLGDARARHPRPTLIDDVQGVRLRLLLSANIPANLPDGWYQMRVEGYASIGDNPPFTWYNNRIFSTAGQGDAHAPVTDVPALIRIGTPHAPRLHMSILGGTFPDERIILPPADYDLIPEQHAPAFALNTRIHASLAAPDGSITLLEDVHAPVSLYQYGDYTLNLTGRADDTFGVTYYLDQTYHITIAQPTALEPAILPATPFVVGDVIAPNLRLTPSLGVPYDVRLILTLIPHDGSPPHVHEITGMSNAYGFFHAPPLQLDHVGEYTLTYEATATHDDLYYATTYHSAGVIVAPESPTAHGQRGIVGQDATRAQTWYDTATYPDDAPDLAPHPHAPFFSGDVLYLPDDPAFALQPALTQGSLPPDQIYLAVSQPAITWREASAHTPHPRLSPDEISPHIGSGLAGLRPTDYAFIMGGIVNPDGVYGYASGMVITADASARVVPAFSQPLMTLDNQPRAILFYASSLMPGSVITPDTPLTLMGYTLPTLPMQAEYTLVSPSGRITRHMTHTNPFGYLYLEGIPADEAGIWQIHLTLTFTGITSAGQITAPVNQHHAWEIYVIPDTPAYLTTPLPTIRPVPPAQPLILNFTPPPTWQDVHARYTFRTPSYHLISADALPVGDALSLTFNRAEWARRYPNIEADGRGTGVTASDALHITLYARGIDADGNLQHAVRTITLWHDTLYTLEDGE